MTTFKQLVDEIALKLQGYGFVQPRATFLSAGVAAGDLTFPVSSTASFGQGIAEIENEMVFIDQADDSGSNLLIAPDGRGWASTAAASHASGTRVTFAPTWPRTTIRAAINETIDQTYPTLFGKGTTSFVFNPSQSTYNLPADVESILAVTADTLGSSKNQQIVRHYDLIRTAPVGEYTTANIITLQESVIPGRTVWITYTKKPSSLSADSDTLVSTGLQESAKLALILGAMANLTAFMDTARLPVDTAAADMDAAVNALGSAAKLSIQFSQLFQMELEKERQRLRRVTPVTVSRSR
jgi:hypothetical protein